MVDFWLFFTVDLNKFIKKMIQPKAGDKIKFQSLTYPQQYSQLKQYINI